MTLQVENMSAVESQETAPLSIKKLKKKMRNQVDANAFDESLKMKAERFNFVEHPTLSRKWKTPNYKTLEQYFVVDSLPQRAEFIILQIQRKIIVKCILNFRILSIL